MLRAVKWHAASVRSSTLLSFAASALALACNTTPVAPSAAALEPDPDQTSDAPPDPTRTQPSEAQPRCETAPNWRPERIDLPPAFAPSMPSGDELLWFAPGMFDPEADDYFSYVFELALDQPPPSQPDELRTLLHAYYRGLMTAVAKDSGRTPGKVVVEVGPENDGKSAAVIKMTNEFNGGAPITVRLDLERTNTCILAVVTPSDDANVRTALERARTCLPCAAE